MKRHKQKAGRILAWLLTGFLIVTAPGMSMLTAYAEDGKEGDSEVVINADAAKENAETTTETTTTSDSEGNIVSKETVTTTDGTFSDSSSETTTQTQIAVGPETGEPAEGGDAPTAEATVTTVTETTDSASYHDETTTSENYDSQGRVTHDETTEAGNYEASHEEKTTTTTEWTVEYPEDEVEAAKVDEGQSEITVTKTDDEGNVSEVTVPVNEDGTPVLSEGEGEEKSLTLVDDIQPESGKYEQAEAGESHTDQTEYSTEVNPGDFAQEEIEVTPGESKEVEAAVDTDAFITAVTQEAWEKEQGSLTENGFEQSADDEDCYVKGKYNEDGTGSQTVVTAARTDGNVTSWTTTETEITRKIYANVTGEDGEVSTVYYTDDAQWELVEESAVNKELESVGEGGVNSDASVTVYQAPEKPDTAALAAAVSIKDSDGNAVTDADGNAVTASVYKTDEPEKVFFGEGDDDYYYVVVRHATGSDGKDYEITNYFWGKTVTRTPVTRTKTYKLTVSEGYEYTKIVTETTTTVTIGNPDDLVRKITVEMGAVKDGNNHAVVTDLAGITVDPSIRQLDLSRDVLNVTGSNSPKAQNGYITWGNGQGAVSTYLIGLNDRFRVQQPTFILTDDSDNLFMGYCADLSVGEAFNQRMSINNADDSSVEAVFKGNAERVRLIALNGYWGAKEGTGSLDAFKELARLAGVAEADIEKITEGLALAVMQAAIWKYGDSKAGDTLTLDDSDPVLGPFIGYSNVNSERSDDRVNFREYIDELEQGNSVSWSGRYSAREVNLLEKYQGAIIANTIYKYLISDQFLQDTQSETSGLTDEDSRLIGKDTITGATVNVNEKGEDDKYDVDVTLHFKTDTLTGNLVLAVEGDNGFAPISYQIAGDSDGTLEKLEVIKGKLTLKSLSLLAGTNLKFTISGQQQLGRNAFVLVSQGSNGNDYSKYQSMITMLERGTMQNVNLETSLLFTVQDPQVRLSLNNTTVENRFRANGEATIEWKEDYEEQYAEMISKQETTQYAVKVTDEWEDSDSNDYTYPEPEPEPEPEPTPEPVPDIPVQNVLGAVREIPGLDRGVLGAARGVLGASRTGDDSSVMMTGFLTAASFTGIVVWVILRMRRRDRKNAA